MEDTVIDLGVMHVKNELLWLSDPIYERNVNQLPNLCYNATIQNAKKGKWAAFVFKEDFGMFGMRNGSLVAFHVDHDDDIDFADFKNYQQITVDSGMAGIFSDKWMNVADKFAVLTQDSEITLPEGFISRSGIGDWVYQTRVIEKNNQVVAIELDFTPLTKEDIEPGKEGLVG